MAVSLQGLSRVFFSRTHAGVGESLRYVDYCNGQTCNEIAVKPSEIFGGQNRKWMEVLGVEHEPYFGNQTVMGKRV